MIDFVLRFVKLLRFWVVGKRWDYSSFPSDIQWFSAFLFERGYWIHPNVDRHESMRKLTTFLRRDIKYKSLSIAYEENKATCKPHNEVSLL